MEKELIRLKRKDRDLIAMLDGLVNRNDVMGSHSLTDIQVETRVIMVTPDLAMKLLERNTSNRHINKVNVNVFANEMSTNKWKFNGEAVVFDFLGILRNGQHRLEAIIKSQTTQPMLIITGIEPESFATMDIGGRRNGGDILSIKNIPDARTTSALCKFIYAFKNSIFTETQHANRTLSNTEIYDYYQTLDSLDDSVEFGSALSKDNSVPLKILNKNQLCGFHYIFGEKNKEHAAEFLEGIFYGNNLDADSPILAMRNRLLKAKQGKNYRLPNREFTMLMVHSWNKWRNNEKAKNIKLPKNLDEFKLEII